jgi:hypothetical protein
MSNLGKVLIGLTSPLGDMQAKQMPCQWAAVPPSRGQRKLSMLVCQTSISASSERQRNDLKVSFILGLRTEMLRGWANRYKWSCSWQTSA